ncbi:MAG: leucine-rich repeat protein [Paramuribaculum sp.]|nr:leucine-rich repeat protein [Paramuribaculum sp.]
MVGNLVIPEKVSNNGVEYTVTGIGEYAFAGCEEMTSVSIPATVTFIGESAFESCDCLEVAEYASIAALCGITFGNEESNPLDITNALYIDGTEVTDVVIPESVTAIGQYAFRRCFSLTSVKIPASVLSIGKDAFLNTGLTKAEFASIESLCSINFENTNSNPLYVAHHLYMGGVEVTNVVIPESVSALKANLFAGGSNIESISLPAELEVIPEGVFFGCSGLKAVTIPERVTTISKNAFNGCTALAMASLPLSVTTIGDFAFYDCGSLTSLTISPAVTSIGKNAFYLCSALKKVAKPNDIDYDFGSAQVYSYARENAFMDEFGAIYTDDKSMLFFVPLTYEGEYTVLPAATSIASKAFSGCSRISGVKIPASVKAIGEHAFEGCEALAKMDFADINTLFAMDLPRCLFGDELYSSDGYITLGRSSCDLYVDGCEVTDVVVPESVTVIREFTFKNFGGIRSVKLGNGVKVIENYAFIRTALESIEFGTSLDSIGAYAFSECPLLTSVRLPDGLRSIGAFAFARCAALEYVYCPASISYFGGNAFYGNVSKKAEFESIEGICAANFENSWGNPLCSTGHLYIGETEVTDLVIPDAVTSIGANSFAGAAAIRSVVIPSSVTTIGESAFMNCTGLLKAEFASVEQLCNFDFPKRGSNPLYYAHHLYVDGAEVTNLRIPESMSKIRKFTFVGCGYVQSVKLPQSLREIGEAAFEGCSAISSIEFPDAVTTIGTSAFEGCSAISSIKFSDSVTTIGASAFKGCSGFTSLAIGNAVTSVGKEAFMNCTGITSVDMGYGLNALESNVFCNCTGLTKISVPNTVTIIRNAAFSDCTNLNEVVLPNTISSIGNFAFYRTALRKAVIPGSVGSIGSSAFSYCSNLKEVVIGYGIKDFSYAFTVGVQPQNVYITALTVPNVDRYVFGDQYTISINVNASAMSAYKTRWSRYSDWNTLVEPTALTLDVTEIYGNAGESFHLTATVAPEDVTLPYVFWRSTDPEIATVDNDGVVTLHVSTSELEGNECRIIAETLYADAPIAVAGIGGNPELSDINELEADAKAGIDYSQPYSVYDLQGSWLGRSVDALSPGFYILRQGSKTAKIMK